MDGRVIARSAPASEGDVMSEMRKCIGSAKFGIEAHEAPVADFPAQPSRKDGLGSMCKPHWKAYVAGLARDRKAKATGGEAPAAVPEPTVGQKLARLNADRKASAAAARAAIRTGAKKPKKPEPIRTRPARTSRAGKAGTVLGGRLPEAISEAVDEASRFALPDPEPAPDALVEEASTDVTVD
jgi:hypothetical protein